MSLEANDKLLAGPYRAILVQVVVHLDLIDHFPDVEPFGVGNRTGYVPDGLILFDRDDLHVVGFDGFTRCHAQAV